MDFEVENLVVRPLVTWWQKLRGLLGTDRSASPVVLMDCDSIHTFWMRYDLDVAFVGEDGHVLASMRGVPPWRVITCRGASYVIERPARDEPWPQVDSRMRRMAVTHYE